MKWNVRVESDSESAALRRFLDGVLAGLIAGGEAKVVVTDRLGGMVVDVEFELSTNKRAMALAKAIASIAEHCFEELDARVTLTSPITGGAS